MKVNKIVMVEDTQSLKLLRKIIRRQPIEEKQKKIKKIKYKFNKR